VPRPAGSGPWPPTASASRWAGPSTAPTATTASWLKPTLQTVADRGLLTDIETLHLDRGYDSAVTTTRCTELGLTDVVCAKKRVKGALKAKKPLTLGMRWPVERTNSWFSNFGQLRRNTDRFTHQRLGQIALAVTLILTVKLVKWAKDGTANHAYPRALLGNNHGQPVLADRPLRSVDLDDPLATGLQGPGQPGPV